MSRVLELCYDLPQQVFNPGETLITQGDPDVKMAVLKQGTVQIIKDGKAIAEVSEPGALFGDMAVALNGEHHATVRAVEVSEFYLINDPRAIMWERPEFHFEVSASLARRLDQMDSLVAHQRHLAVDQDEVRQIAVEMLQETLDQVIEKHEAPATGAGRGGDISDLGRVTEDQEDIVLSS